jgi:uncharacterized OB-fold protein
MANSQAVISFYDQPMWKSIHRERWELQQCDDCSKFQYPPSPACPHCLSMSLSWKPVSGRGTIISWVVFHRQYFDDYPPPYNVVTVQLDEGPLVITNLVGEEPQGSWIDRKVEVVYAPDVRGEPLPKVRLVD